MVTRGQIGFAELGWILKGKRTRREEFLAEMELAVPWKDLERIIEPHAPRERPGEKGGRIAHGVGTMLRVYFCQQWYQLSDESAEDTLYGSESVRRFCMSDASRLNIPDATTITRFRHMLEQHQLQEKMFERVNSLLKTRGILMQTGTIVDASAIQLSRCQLKTLSSPKLLHARQAGTTVCLATAAGRLRKCGKTRQRRVLQRFLNE